MIQPRERSELFLINRRGACDAARPPPSHRAESRLDPPKASGAPERPWRARMPKAKAVVTVPVKERRAAGARQFGDVT